MDYIDILISNCQIAKSLKPKSILTFRLDDIHNQNLHDIKHAIYIIEELDADAERTFNALKEYKEKKERACPKLNTASNVLYVGSSTTGLKSRLIQHYGDGYKGTLLCTADIGIQS